MFCERLVDFLSYRIIEDVFSRLFMFGEVKVEEEYYMFIIG